MGIEKQDILRTLSENRKKPEKRGYLEEWGRLHERWYQIEKELEALRKDQGVDEVRHRNKPRLVCHSVSRKDVQIPRLQNTLEFWVLGFWILDTWFCTFSLGFELSFVVWGLNVYFGV